MLGIGKASIGLCPRTDLRTRAGRYTSPILRRVRPLNFSNYGAIQTEGAWLRYRTQVQARRSTIVKCKGGDKALEKAEADSNNRLPAASEVPEDSEESELIERYITLRKKRAQAAVRRDELEAEAQVYAEEAQTKEETAKLAESQREGISAQIEEALREEENSSSELEKLEETVEELETNDPNSDSEEVKNARLELSEAVRRRSKAKSTREALEAEALNFVAKANQSRQAAEAAERAANAAMEQAASALKDESDIATEIERIEKKLEQTGVTPSSIIIQTPAAVKDTVETVEDNMTLKPSEKEESQIKDQEFFEAEPEQSKDEVLIEKGNYIARFAVGLTLIGAAIFHIEREFGFFKYNVQPAAVQMVDKGKKFLGFDEETIHEHKGANTEQASGHEDIPTILPDLLWLLLASVIFVPAFQRMPGGSPILGYLAAGALIGPNALGIVKDVGRLGQLGEFGVVFLLFNIGLELSWEKLQAMRKLVFGVGTLQVVGTAMAVALTSATCAAVSSASMMPAASALLIGGALALSSTAVVLQVLRERGENQTKHGRIAFSVLLLQDIAVVVLLIMIPLIAPNQSGEGSGLGHAATALGFAALKAAACIGGLIWAGRKILRPFYKRIASGKNAEIFAATTLVTCLGTSVLTLKAGLSMALGAFLAGLLLSETEYALQVESDIQPYRGILLGLFFVTVGMEIDFRILFEMPLFVVSTIVMLVAGKALIVATLGKVFGLGVMPAVKAGLLLAPGGEFAFVLFGEAVSEGIISSQMGSALFLVVAFSMATIPFLAQLGDFIASKASKDNELTNLAPSNEDADELSGHIIIAGFGRVGQMISQLMYENGIPFAAVDVRVEKVLAGRQLGLPVYFGDAGSPSVLHCIGAERAIAAVITLDTPGANYRAVWAMKRAFPNLRIFVRAHDVEHGVNLERAGATAVVPETLEPSLQLSAALLAEANVPEEDITVAIADFRRNHMSELTAIASSSGFSLGYGYASQIGASKSENGKNFEIPGLGVNDNKAQSPDQKGASQESVIVAAPSEK